MTTWTDSARKYFDDYCGRARTALDGKAVDADEVLEDLRRHVEEEARAAGLSVLTEADLKQIVARIGDPAIAAETPEKQAPRDIEAKPGAARGKKRPGFLLLTFGVILPAITVLFELFTGVSASVLFDPIPSGFHNVIVALVPVANFLIWRAARRSDSRHATALGWLNGAALGTSLFYSVLYLPFTPFAALAVIWFGLGLIPLAPWFALLVIPFLRAAYRRNLGRDRLPGAWGGTLAALALLGALQIPAFLHHRGLANAVSDDPVTSRAGIRTLRAFGSHELLLRACYGFQRNNLKLDVVRALAGASQSVPAEKAREVYYRVTGRPFNSVPPPSLYTRSGRWNALDEEFTWDDALGGDGVAGRVKGLSLVGSRLDAIAEPNAAVVYCEWTMEFKNVSSQPREARAQIILPPGAVVSRLTLWVDGEPREAAFAGRAAVKDAYREVAVVQRRDPVLVTTCGPDRVLVQCFPVPPDGSVMKVRLGITAPLQLESPDRGRFLWPRFLERNFALGDQFAHSLWIESPGALEARESADAKIEQRGGKFAWHGPVTEAAVQDRSIIVRRSTEVSSMWTPALAEGKFIRQTIATNTLAPPQRLALVVDGSAGMGQFMPEFSEALSSLSEIAEVAVVVAGDEPISLFDKPQKLTAPFLVEMNARIRRLRFEGGQDNVPALEKGWDLAAGSDRGNVVWVHGPQSARLSSADGLRQRLERTGNRAQLFELQLADGPDRILEDLDGLVAVQHESRTGTVKADLEKLFGRLLGKIAEYRLDRELLDTQPDEGVKAASRHIERLWARDEVLRLRNLRQPAAAVELAARQQIVTSLSGAVVLEKKQQFAQHGLTPAGPAAVPTVPEPETWVLLIAGITLLFLSRGRFNGRLPMRGR